MRDLSELIERLEKLTGPARGIDAEIALLLLPDLKGWVTHPNAKPDSPDWMRGELWPSAEAFADWLIRDANVKSCQAPSFTGSLDAAIALQKRVLPGWEWQAGDDAILGRYAAVYRSSSVGAAGFGEEDIVNAATPAIALVLATLKALQSQGGVDG